MSCWSQGRLIAFSPDFASFSHYVSPRVLASHIRAIVWTLFNWYSLLGAPRVCPKVWVGLSSPTCSLFPCPRFLCADALLLNATLTSDQERHLCARKAGDTDTAHTRASQLDTRGGRRGTPSSMLLTC